MTTTTSPTLSRRRSRRIRIPNRRSPREGEAQGVAQAQGGKEARGGEDREETQVHGTRGGGGGGGGAAVPRPNPNRRRTRWINSLARASNPGGGGAKKKKVVTVMDEETGEEFTKTVWVDDGNEVPEGAAAATANVTRMRSGRRPIRRRRNRSPSQNPRRGRNPWGAGASPLSSPRTDARNRRESDAMRDGRRESNRRVKADAQRPTTIRGSVAPGREPRRDKIVLYRDSITTRCARVTSDIIRRAPILAARLPGRRGAAFEDVATSPSTLATADVFHAARPAHHVAQPDRLESDFAVSAQ